MALFIAASVKEVSTPLSNLKLASVCKPCDLDVFRIEVGLKTADSMKMEVVSLEIPEDRPPYTPAIQKFSRPFVIISSSPLSFRSKPSKVVKDSPFLLC